MVYFQNDPLAPEGPVILTETLWLQDPGILRVGTNASSDGMINVGKLGDDALSDIAIKVSMQYTLTDQLDTFILRQSGGYQYLEFNFDSATLPGDPGYGIKLDSVQRGQVTAEETYWQLTDNPAPLFFTNDEWDDVYINHRQIPTQFSSVAWFGDKAYFAGDLGFSQAFGDLLEISSSLNAPELINTDDTKDLILRSSLGRKVQVQVNSGVVNTTLAEFNDPTNANETSMILYDENSSTLKRVSVGAVDSGGTGFRLLRIPN